MEEIPPKELNAYISEFYIITVRKKDKTKTMNPAPYVVWWPVLNGI